MGDTSSLPSHEPSSEPAIVCVDAEPGIDDMMQANVATTTMASLMANLEGDVLSFIEGCPVCISATAPLASLGRSTRAFQAARSRTQRNAQPVSM